MYLNLDKDNRILSASYENIDGSTEVLELPEGDITEFLYVDEVYVWQPLIKSEIVIEPSQIDKVEAQAVYTAAMTDTLIGE